MKIWHISDTHACHGFLKIPTDVDMVIHSGDCSNHRDPYRNESEVLNFIEWFSTLPIKRKIFVAGNHDTSIERRLVTPGYIASKGIVYLENTFTQIEGLTIWGTPITPEFGIGWAWNRKRDKMYKVWDSVPVDSHIVISHGPPKGVLDATYDREGLLEFCGCTNMLKKMIQLQPKLCLFGHIHSCEGVLNAGTRTLSNCGTVFSNGSCQTDGKFGVLSSHGNILEL